jgi:hypothetical protein
MDYSKFYLFIKREIGVDIGDNSQNYDLVKDFNLYGDEAESFISIFSNEFDVNIDGFRYDRYFNPEIDAVSLFFKKLLKNESKQKLTTDDLKKAIEKGKLI